MACDVNLNFVLCEASRLRRLVAMADQPQERSGEAFEDVSLQQVKTFRTVDFDDHDQQLSYPSGPDLTNAMHLLFLPIGGPSVDNNGIKLLFLQHGHQEFAALTESMLAVKVFQQTLKVPDRRPLIQNQNFAV